MKNISTCDMKIKKSVGFMFNALSVFEKKLFQE